LIYFLLPKNKLYPTLTQEFQKNMYLGVSWLNIIPHIYRDKFNRKINMLLFRRDLMKKCYVSGKISVVKLYKMNTG
jgi:hypothetical protein